MRQELSRERVNGFLRAEGMELRNGRDEKVLLLGWGLGNWLLQEGYMWGLGEFSAFDRPRRIEQTVEDLTGGKYAQRFWKRFRENYIAEADLSLMAEQGYNSLRVPINARLFLEEGPGLRFREEGFAALDALLDGCERHGLYVWIDLHGAPGGQTGANIDDSMDDLCRLLIDQNQFERGLALWEEIARRYRDRWIVAGYDLLNEPIRPVRFEGDVPLEMYEPRLREFYEQAIARIRRVDDKHLISLEGIHWATDTALFDHRYDDQMVLHFHRYGCAPERKALEAYLEAARRLNVPIWLGETGENTLPWMAAMIPMALDLGIQVTLWPWKKMDCRNSPCSVRPPENWRLIREYLEGGPRPDYETAQKIFDEYLDNIRAERCRENSDLTPHLLRTPGCAVQGTDFDEQGGPDISWHAEGEHPAGVYRQNTGMDIRPAPGEEEKLFPFDGPWRETELCLHPGEWAAYTFQDVTSSCGLEIACMADQPGVLEVRQREHMLGTFDISGCGVEQVLSGMHLTTAEDCLLRVISLEGEIRIRRVTIHPLPAI